LIDPFWWRDYRYLEYHTLDCAELAEKVQREVFGRKICLPDTGDNVRANSRKIKAEVGNYALPTKAPEDGDAVLIKSGSLWHIGTFFNYEGVDFVLHTTKKSIWSVTHAVRDLPLINMQIEGYYRWIEAKDKKKRN